MISAAAMAVAGLSRDAAQILAAVVLAFFMLGFIATIVWRVSTGREPM
jgi:hypothetical protein